MMMKFMLLCIAVLAFWPKLAMSEVLSSASTLTTVVGTSSAAGEQPISTSATDASIDTSLSDAPANVSVIPPEKDIRLQCGFTTLFSSQVRDNVWYLRSSCSGVWNTFHTTRCSYLDLNLCYVSIDGRIKPAPRGGFGPSCYDCVLFNDRGNNMMRCSCDPGHDEVNLMVNTVNLDETLTVDNGFLSCHGMTNFECPPPGEDA